MAKSLVIKREGDDGYALYLREWYFQGDRPEYTYLKRLSRDEAAELARTSTVHDHTGDFE